MASITSSTMKLMIEKGPRKGETLEFNPRSTVRIGRVVRGNNLAIKDPGISSKHLSIGFNSDSGNWVITDLESSNGTYLNSSLIKSLSPFELRNGDEIKIGELTSIMVEIIQNEEEISVRRNTRRQAAPKSGCLDLSIKVEVKAEGGTDLGEGSSDRARLRDVKREDAEKGADNSRRENRIGHGRGRTKKRAILEDVSAGNDGVLMGLSENVENVKPNEGRRMGMRRTRSSKRDGDGLLVPAEVVPARRNRGAKNEENVMGSSMPKISESEALDGDDCKEVEIIELVEDKKKRAGRGRKKKVDAECSENAQNVGLENSKNLEGLEADVLNMREQPLEEPADNTAQQDIVEEMNREIPDWEVKVQVGGEVAVESKPCEEPVNDTTRDCTEVEIIEMVEGKKKQAGRGRRKKLDAECSENARDVGLEDSKNTEGLEMDVPDMREQPLEKLADDTAQQDIVKETNREIPDWEVNLQAGDEVVVEVKPCEEPVNDTQQNMMEKTTCEESELEDPGQAGGTLDAGEHPSDEIRKKIDIVSASHFEQETCDGLEDVVLKEGGVNTLEMGEISKELDKDRDCSRKVCMAGDVPDLEKMTLGEWFDYLEVILPKQINDVTDQIIEDMRKRAKQFDDFLLQQQNSKGKLPLTT